jgi:hypothetical protein
VHIYFWLISRFIPIILYFLSLPNIWVGNWGSSVSFVSDYRLGGRGSIPGRGKDFTTSLCVQTSSKAHPASYPMGTGNPVSGGKRGRSVTLTTHIHLVPRSRMSRSYNSSHPWSLHGSSGTVLLLPYQRYGSPIIYGAYELWHNKDYDLIQGVCKDEMLFLVFVQSRLARSSWQIFFFYWTRVSQVTYEY